MDNPVRSMAATHLCRAMEIGGGLMSRPGFSENHRRGALASRRFQPEGATKSTGRSGQIPLSLRLLAIISATSKKNVASSIDFPTIATYASMATELIPANPLGSSTSASTAVHLFQPRQSGRDGFVIGFFASAVAGREQRGTSVSARSTHAQARINKRGLPNASLMASTCPSLAAYPV